MHILKLGHCCLHITHHGLSILTDPGRFSTAQDSLTGIDVVLITHEHADHVHVESLAAVLANNPSAEVITNSAVATLLAKDGIACTVLEGTASTERKGVSIEAHDGKHEEIFEAIGQVQNTGYFIGEKLFYPGDAFHVPGKEVDVLALPVAGPWCKMADAIRYVLEVAPRMAIPVHDGTVTDSALFVFHGLPQNVLSANGISFVALKNGEECDC